MTRPQKTPLTGLQKVLLGLIGLLIAALVLFIIVPDSRTLNFSRLTETPASSEPEPLPETGPEAIMPGRNHNKQAESYAYDIKDIQAYLTGEKAYTGEKLVFLTIDDGANFQVTPVILDILKEHGVPATFFPIGAYITEDKASLYQRQIREGHALGLHSYYHDFSLLYPGGWPDTNQILEEANAAHKSFKSLLGLKFHSRVWRYPGGAMSWEGLDDTHAALAKEDYHWIDWNANVGDAEGVGRRPETLEDMLAFHQQSADSFADTPENIRVVLMHDTEDKQLTINALPHIIQYYKDQGYKFGILY